MAGSAAAITGTFVNDRDPKRKVAKARLGKPRKAAASYRKGRS